MKSLTKGVLFAGALLAGHLYAQPSNSPTAPSATAEKATPASNLSPEEMRENAQELRAQVRTAIQYMQAQQTKARKQQDIIKLTCVNDKFIKLKAQANLFDQAQRDLLSAFDTNGRTNAYERVTKTANDIRAISEEAAVCIGEPQLGSESESGYTAPEIIDNPTQGLPFDVEVEPPAFASPYI